MGKWKNEINPNIEEEVKNTPRGVLVGAPHTSLEDGFRAMKFMTNQKIQEVIPPGKIKIVMKASMFPPIIGNILKKMGFIPVDRNNPQEFWKNSIKTFSEMEDFFWSFAAEGTRRPVKKWPSGFLRAAERFNIPILVAYIDYKERRTRIEKIIPPEEFLTDGSIDPEKLPALENMLSEILKDASPKVPKNFNPDVKIKWGNREIKKEKEK